MLSAAENERSTRNFYSFKYYFAFTNTLREIEIALNYSILKGDIGMAQHHVSLHLSEGNLPFRAHQTRHHPVHHLGELCAGNPPLRLE
ncbi:hypothetical protein D3C73_864410 [compost metagenome]